MSNYAKYRDSVGIKNADMIRAIRGSYKNYSGATNAMVNNPERYGVCLLPEAEKILVANFGSGSGLDYKAEKPIRKACLRKKPNRLSVYLSDDMYRQIIAVMHEDGCDTVQEFLYRILEDYLGG